MNDAIEAIDKLFNAGLAKVILGMLTISSFFVVAETLGLLPSWLSDRINRNKLHETMRLLREFGIDVETARRTNDVARLEQIPGRDLAERVNARLKVSTLHHPFVLGAEISVRGESYIDLMGATSELAVARVYARDLSAVWRTLADVGGKAVSAKVDFIVAPKSGSPMLAACFAESLRKPLLLHNSEPKFRSDPDDAKAFFDCRDLPSRGSQGLLVDDSSTGGGKAAKVIEDARRYGWNISDFLVVFEPQLKAATQQNAAARLKPLGVTLHSIVKT